MGARLCRSPLALLQAPQKLKEFILKGLERKRMMVGGQRLFSINAKLLDHWPKVAHKLAQIRQLTREREKENCIFLLNVGI